VSPNVSAENPPNQTSRDTELTCQGGGRRRRSGCGSDGTDIAFGEPRVSIPFAAVRSSLTLGISHVVEPRAEEEMTRTNAGRRIAVMADVVADGEWANPPFVCPTMS